MKICNSGSWVCTANTLNWHRCLFTHIYLHSYIFLFLSQSPVNVPLFSSQALQLIGLLSGSFCKYMPLLIVDQVTVLSDLPVTLPSLLSNSGWNSIAESLVLNLFASTERIYAWAMLLENNDYFLGPESIDRSESCRSVLLARVMLNTCVSLKDYLPFEKQLRLANMVIP